jgi:hypothetical protein
MAENNEHQFGQGWNEYLRSEYSLSPAKPTELLEGQDSSEPAEYKFGTGNEEVMNSYEKTLAPSDDIEPIQNYAEKIIPSAIIGASVAPFTASGSAAYQAGKYGLQRSPSASTMLRMAGPALDVLKGRPPADLMQRAAQAVSNPAFERGILGAIEDTAGTTGRARQTMYNTETARQAAVRRGVDNPFTKSTWGATNAGVLVPPGSQPPKPVGGLSSIFSPQARQAATKVKDFASAVVPKAAARGMGGFGLGFSGAETMRTGAEAAKDPSAIPEFVLNAMGTLGALGMYVPGAAPVAAPFAFGAPALASVIGMAREGLKQEAKKNLAAKERFLAMPETTPGERGLPINARPAMSRQELGYRDARKGALYFAEP